MFQCGHMRLTVRCGLCMYKMVFPFKNVLGAAYSQVRVIVRKLRYLAVVIPLLITCFYIVLFWKVTSTFSVYNSIKQTWLCCFFGKSQCVAFQV